MVIKENILSAAAYLEAERNRSKDEGKREFVFRQLIEMAGASKYHNLIVSNLLRALGDPLNEKGFEVVASDLRVINPEKSSFVYPDIVVFHDDTAFFLDDHLDTLANPSLVFEVLSDSTEAWDRGDKFRLYRSIESLNVYVLISQKRPLIEVFSRTEDNNWHITSEDDLERSVLLKQLDLSLPLSKVYRKVSFEEEITLEE